MFGSKPSTRLGVDLGAGGIKLVELKKIKGRPVLNTYGLTSEPQDVHGLANTAVVGPTADTSKSPVSEETIGEYANLLKSVCKQSHVLGKIATVSLPVSSVFHAAVNLPILKKENALPALKSEVRKLLPRPIEEMALDYQVLPVKDGAESQTYLVNAVPRDIVAIYTQIFKRAGLELDALEPESLALARSLVGRDNAVTMLLDIGRERSNFFIVEDGVVVTHTSVETGGAKVNEILAKNWNLAEALAEQAKFDSFSNLMSLPKTAPELLVAGQMLAPVILPIIKEIEYNFDLYSRRNGNASHRPEKIILTGGASMLPTLTDAIADKFKIKCYVGDPWGRVVYQDGLKPALRKVGPRLSVAIGLALRGVV
ncbi:MAG: hypothetical protein A3J93_04010 [Candidatus Magasanikbacteria bacterium RIFOXYC2_FULL_42_28]|uniref:SHS2 domain-containing protein n=1 Tax=Candidatus Magasanikbacteria bacterium RIFOXYC2_FULL_42_28 TaxID=1798704 RepID=A0A1F6NUQ3_9BACT|nr:MAG: hypothetical protein A3J93_04010 [Candidatus Magasanikbacteria bacterium RIFOXYC2_FULL_42_28]